MASRPFHDLVAEFGEGEFTERAGEIWAEIMRALKTNGGKATSPPGRPRSGSGSRRSAAGAEESS